MIAIRKISFKATLEQNQRSRNFLIAVLKPDLQRVRHLPLLFKSQQSHLPRIALLDQQERKVVPFRPFWRAQGFRTQHLWKLYVSHQLGRPELRCRYHKSHNFCIVPLGPKV